MGWHCEHASDGCRFCYSELQINRRFGTGLPYKPGHRKDVDLFLDEKMLEVPFRWRKPRMIFVCSMTDLFADFVSDEWIMAMFSVMAKTPHHTYQILTKRAQRMRAVLTDWQRTGLTLREGCGAVLPNVWLGISAEDQENYDARWSDLSETPAVVRFVSYEPAIGPLWLPAAWDVPHWLICGGESGQGARYMQPEWARSIRDQCAAKGIAFFMKQMTGKKTYPRRFDGAPVSKTDGGTSSMSIEPTRIPPEVQIRKYRREADHWRHECKRLELENANLRKRLSMSSTPLAWDAILDGRR